MEKYFRKSCCASWSVTNIRCDLLFAEASAQICKREGVDTRFNSLDTTTFTLTDEYDVDCDEHTIEITHGYSKDHRPDLKQSVLEMMSHTMEEFQ